MYERMLDKRAVPTLADMAAFCGENAGRFTQLNQWLSDTFQTEQAVVFPYGNRYGWGVAHRKKRRLICNVFAEDNAFTVMLRVSDAQCERIYARAHAYLRQCLDTKHPCSDGGWIHYRVTDAERLDDIRMALTVRCSQPRAGVAKEGI